MAEKSRDPFDPTGIGHHRFDRKNRPVPVRTFTQVESGMRVEDLKTAHDQNRQAEDIDPMGKTDQ